jgi:hypothetical protein
MHTTTITATRRGLAALAVAIIALMFAATMAFAGGGNSHHEEADGCDHGNSSKPCRPDPQPDHGKDCDKHGNHGGINEDHCAGTPSPTSTGHPTSTGNPTTSTPKPTHTHPKPTHSTAWPTRTHPKPVPVVGLGGYTTTCDTVHVYWYDTTTAPVVTWRVTINGQSTTLARVANVGQDRTLPLPATVRVEQKVSGSWYVVVATPTLLAKPCPTKTTPGGTPSNTTSPTTTSSTTSPTSPAVKPPTARSTTHTPASHSSTTTSQPSPITSSRTPTGDTPSGELAFTGVSNAGAVTIFAAAVVALGALFYLAAGRVRKDRSDD